MTSERTISQVRAILNKLDRSIDEARERRTHPAPAPVRDAAPQPRPQPVAPPTDNSLIGAPPSAPASTTAPGRNASPFGRAQPLNRPQGGPSWRS